MKLRSILIAIVSLAVGLALLALLVNVSGLRLQEVLSRLSAVDKLACLWLIGLIAVNALLSSLKWRITDRAVRHTSDGLPSHFESFALSIMGSALGQILPVQISMPAARTLGTRIHGRAFQRGALGTFFEQSFDAFFSCSLILASVLTYSFHGGWRLWLIIAVPSAVLAIVLAGMALALMRSVAAKTVSDGSNAAGWRRFVVKLGNSALLEPALGRKLMALSALRFVVLVLTAGETTAAIHGDIPLWHLAAAMPFAVLSMAAGITPGGLGLTEFTYLGVLRAFGTPLAATTQWALANRFLAAGGYLILAVVLLPLFLAFRTAAAAAPSESAAP